jgi:hypothetical protein
MEKAMQEVRMKHQLMQDAVEGFVMSMVFDEVDGIERVHAVSDGTKLDLRNLLLDLVNLWRKKQVASIRETRTIDAMVAEVEDIISGNEKSKDDDTERRQEARAE